MPFSGDLAGIPRVRGAVVTVRPAPRRGFATIASQLNDDWHRAIRGITLTGAVPKPIVRGTIMRSFVIIPCLAALVATPALAAGGTGIGKGHTMGFPSDTPAAATQEVTLAGKITNVDSTSSSFSAHGKTFQTSTSTTYDLGGQQGSFGDLKVGEKVKVQYHVDGATDAADSVVVKTKS